MSGSLSASSRSSDGNHFDAAATYASDGSSVTQTHGAWFSPMPAIPGCRIIREISRGGQGVVFEGILETQDFNTARDVRTSSEELPRATKAMSALHSRRVAIKVLKLGSEATDTERRRFEREIRLLTTLEHPNVVQVLQSGLGSDGSPFAIMEYVEGRPLQDYIRENNLNLEQVIRLLMQVCDGLSAAHEVGIIHRDVKPSNILVRPNGTVCLLDFGLAKRLDTMDGKLTSTDDVLGTMPYMSPEQATGSPNLDERSDVYSLGVVMYKLLSGQFPYPVGSNLADVVHHILETPPARLEVQPRLRGDHITGNSSIVTSESTATMSGFGTGDSALRRIVARALEKEPRSRYQNARHLRTDLERCLAGKRVGMPRLPVIGKFRHALLRIARRQPAVLVLSISILVGVLAWRAGDHLFLGGLRLNSYYLPALLMFAPTTSDVPTRVVLVECPAFEELARIGQQYGLNEINPARKTGFRSVLAALVTPLVKAGAPAILLPGPPSGSGPHDPLFADALRKAQEAGTAITAPFGNWPGLPVVPGGLGEAFLGLIDVRPYPGRLEGSVLTHQLAAELGNREAVLSQPLLSTAMARHPGWRPDARWGDGSPPVIKIRYWRPSPDDPLQREWADFSDFVPYQLEHRVPEAPSLRIAALGVPVNKTPAADTIPLERVFSASPQELRETVNERIVIISSPPPEMAFIDMLTREQIPASVATTHLMQTLLSTVNATPSEILNPPGWLESWLAALAGCLAGFRFSHAWLPRLVTLIVGIALLLTISVVLLWNFFIWVPMLAATSWVSAAEALAWIRRRSIRSWEMT